MSEDQRNPYIDLTLTQSQQQFCPEQNKEFEDKHNVTKKTKKRNKRRRYRFMPSKRDSNDSDDSPIEAAEEHIELTQDRILRGNEDNASKLVTKYVRDQEHEFKLSIPSCIGTLCFQFSYEPTNIIFTQYDPRVKSYVTVSNEGKIVNISSRTVFVFSKDGYDSGHHIWHIKCHRVYNCQALGITERRNAKYRYGDNIFDVALNDQLGDRYIYAGDNGHSWRGSMELRPYVCSVIGDEEYYTKRLKLDNSRWDVGDIITVDVNFGSGRRDDDEKRMITFLKNGEALCEPIRVVKKCMYYPVFQVYQRGMFEVIDDISTKDTHKVDTESEFDGLND